MDEMDDVMIASNSTGPIEEYELFLINNRLFYLKNDLNDDLALINEDIDNLNKAKEEGKTTVRYITYDNMDVNITFE